MPFQLLRLGCCSDQFLKVSLIVLGFITFLVAALGARRVEGVDVDLTLISKALKCLGVVTEILPKSLERMYRF